MAAASLGAPCTRQTPRLSLSCEKVRGSRCPWRCPKGLKGGGRRGGQPCGVGPSAPLLQSSSYRLCMFYSLKRVLMLKLTPQMFKPLDWIIPEVPPRPKYFMKTVVDGSLFRAGPCGPLPCWVQFPCRCFVSFLGFQAAPPRRPAFPAPTDGSGRLYFWPRSGDLPRSRHRLPSSVSPVCDGLPFHVTDPALPEPSPWPREDPVTF